MSFNFKGNLEVPNDGTIGSVGKDDALTIGSGGDLTIKGNIEIYSIKKDPPTLPSQQHP